MRHPLARLTAGLFAAAALAAPAAAQFNQPIFATPLPPGPGTVPIVPNSRLVAPVLLPVGAPTASPVAIYQYPPSPGAQAQAAGVSGWDAVADSCGSPANACTPAARCGNRFWVTADFLYAAVQASWVPPLVTASPPGTPLATAGALYQPNTFVLFGGEREDTRMRPGLRLGAGYWFDPSQANGVDASFFFLGDLSRRFVGSSAPGGIVLARPFVDGATGLNSAVTATGFSPGGVTASVDTSLVGADVNYRRSLVCADPCRVDLLAGYRYLHLGDTVDVWQTGGTPLAAAAVAPLAPLVHDSFRTRNNFHGGQLGLVTGTRMASGLSLELITKVALGVTVARADVDGTTVLPGGAVLPGGLLATTTNDGSRTTDYFAVVPEADLRLGYAVTENLRVNAGYMFLYWSKVRRAADQIDLTVQPAAGRPAFRNDTTDLWVQGLTLGLELRY